LILTQISNEIKKNVNTKEPQRLCFR